MESMVKALYMAAAVLIGVLILTLAATLFRSGAELNMSYDTGLATKALAKFNARIEALITRNHNNSLILTGEGARTNYDSYDYSSAEEVISVVNLAYDYNKQSEYDKNNQIKVFIYNEAGTLKYRVEVTDADFNGDSNMLKEGCLYEGTSQNQVTFADFLKEYGANMIEPNIKPILESKSYSEADAIKTQNNYIYQYLFKAKNIEFDTNYSGKINKIEFEIKENELYNYVINYTSP